MGYVTAGLTALSALGLAPLLSMPDQMYESAIKQGPQGVDGEYQIGPGRWLLGKFDPRFTKKGLGSGRDRYVLEEIVNKDPDVRQARRLKIRKPELGESLEDYIDDTSGAVEDALKKKRNEGIVEEYTLLDNLPQNVRARKQADLDRIREDNKFKLEMGMINQANQRQYDYQTELLLNQKNQMQNNLNVAMGELSLKQQQAGWKNDLYHQQLKDNKEFKQQALLAAALEGLGMTITGIVKG